MKSVFVFLLFAHAVFANCPIPELSAQSMNEAGIRQFVSRYAQAGLPIEKFACCLPEVFKNHYAVAHSSFAAQDSIPQSPRVIMTNLQPQSNGHVQLPSAFFSMNGGHPNLRQTKSVELALVNPNTGRLDLFDIDFKTGRAHMGPANPPQCIACHGTLGKMGATGPHLIFDGPLIWPRFVNGMQLLPKLEKHPTSPQLQKYFHRLEVESVQALKQNVRFQCLNPKIPNAQFLNSLDLAIGKLNSIKVAEEVINSKNYHQYKFALFGARLCKSMLQDVDCQIQSQIHRPVKNCNQWIHPRKISSLNQVSTISNSIKELTLIGEADQLSLGSFLSRRNEIERLVQDSNESNSTEKVAFEFRRGFIDFKQHILPQNLKGIKSLVLRKYAIDNELRGSQVNLLIRFLFESRGVEISNWSTDVVAGYQRSGIDLDVLLRYEPLHSHLRNALRSDSSQICENLRNLSWNATR